MLADNFLRRVQMAASTPEALNYFNDVLVSHTNIRKDSSTTFVYGIFMTLGELSETNIKFSRISISMQMNIEQHFR